MWDLIKSRRFQTAIVGMIVAILTQLVPDLAGKESELSGIIAIVVIALLGSYTLDHATYNLGGAAKVDAENRGIVEIGYEVIADDGAPANPWEPYPPDKRPPSNPN